MSDEESNALLRDAWGVKYWFCIDSDGIPLIFDYNDEPERVPGRGWIGVCPVSNHSVDRKMIPDYLFNSTNFNTEPVEVCFSPLENSYYHYDHELEKRRHRSLFPEQYKKLDDYSCESIRP
ncbi:MAG: hypothetical protein IBX55_00590 [Methyloprofundus sp.]|nr:hypothetical protein [Methyloprofundus sp.]